MAARRKTCDSAAGAAMERPAELSERLDAEALRAESAIRLRALSDNLPGGLVYQIDSGCDGTERRFTHIGHAVEALHELSAKAVLANPMLLYDQVWPEDRGLVAQREAEAARTLTPLQMEVRIRLPSGGTRWRLFASAPRRLASGRLVWDGIELDITERKRAEEDLRRANEQLERRVAERTATLAASEARYRSLLDTLHEGIWQIDARGRTTFVNPCMAGMLGYSPAEMNGRPLFDFMDAAGQRDARARLARRRRGEGEVHDFTFQHRNGAPVHASINTRPLFDADGVFQGAIAGIRDVTLQKEAEDRTRFQLDFLRIAAETSAALLGVRGAASFDATVNRALRRLGVLFGADRSYLFQFSENMERMHNTHEWCAAGVSPQQQRRQRMRSADFPWWTRQMRRRHTVHIPDVADLPPEARTERRVLRRQGVRALLCLPTLSVGGALTGFLGFDMVRGPHRWSDERIEMLRIVAHAVGAALTRRQAETALAESEFKFRTIFDSVQDGIFLWDLGQQRFFLANRACLSMLRYSLHAFQALGLEALHSREDASAIRRMLASLSAGQVRPQRREIRFRRRDGRLFVADCAATLARLKGVDYVLVVLRDISERKRLEAEIERIAENERQRIGHDLHDGLGQSLTGISFLAGAVRASLRERSAPEAAELDKLVSHVQRAMRQTREMARGLFVEEFGRTGLVPALRELAANTTDLFGVSCLCRARGPIALGDAHVARHLYRIAQEAVTNAVRHSRGRRILITLRQGRGRTRLTVRDDGIGMRLGARRDGHMGMRTMQRRADLIGAHLCVRSKPGEGTTVACELRQSKT